MQKKPDKADTSANDGNQNTADAANVNEAIGKFAKKASHSAKETKEDDKDNEGGSDETNKKQTSQVKFDITMGESKSEETKPDDGGDGKFNIATYKKRMLYFSNDIIAYCLLKY